MRVSGRARRMTIRISALDGRVTLTRPPWVPAGEAYAFAAEKAGWVRDRLAHTPAPRFPVLGAELPVGGVAHRIVPGRPGIGAGCLRVRPDGSVPHQAGAILKEAARRHLRTAVDRHAKTLTRSPGRITLRDTRSRWGSCNERGDLMFSWRLVMAPPSVLDYVAAHEVAHLERMDHSAVYWRVCERLCPDWRRERDWLRAHGADIHAWRFDAVAGAR